MSSSPRMTDSVIETEYIVLFHISDVLLIVHRGSVEDARYNQKLSAGRAAREA